MAHRGEMFVEGQNSVKKELIKRFSMEDFSQIDMLPEEGEDEGQEEERQENETNPSDSASSENNIIVIDDNITGAWEEHTKENPPNL